MRTWLLAAALIAQALAFTGCSLARTEHARNDALMLYRELRSNEQEYQAALAAESELMQSVSEWLAGDHHGWSKSEAGRLRKEFAAVSLEFARVHNALRNLDLTEDVQQDVLGPILRQLASERADMEALGAMLGGQDLDLGAIQAKVEAHRHPENLFTPAIKRIRERYGVARQRMWRGRPLTV